MAIAADLIVRHASDVGWTVVAKDDALRKRGGEQGLFFYDELRDGLLRLNPGLVTADNVQSIISRMEGVRPNIEGNREILEWLRGRRSVLDENEKRNRNVTVIDYEHPERNHFHVAYEWASRAPGRKGNRAATPNRAMAQQVEEFLAQIDFLRGEIEAVRKKLR